MSPPTEPSNLRDLIEMAQRIQSEAARVKDDLGRKTVEGEAGGGLVRCVVSGAGEVLSLEIDPSLARLDTPGNTKLLGDLVLGAVNVGLERARELARAELAKVTGGLPMPPGMFGDS